MPIKKPLADLIRPKNLSQFVGQTKLISEGKPLYQIIKNHVPISLLLWGPPGTGKTSLAQIIAREYDYPLATFNASIDNKAKLMHSSHDDNTAGLSSALFRERANSFNWGNY